MYSIIRRVLFLFPTETVHYFSMNVLKLFCSIPLCRKFLKKVCGVSNQNLSKTIWGIPFKHPIGLAAGFDKNALYLRELDALGFAFVEIGTVTPLPQEGNPKPRLFRLIKDKALINRMGFNNEGVVAVASRLKDFKAWAVANNIDLVVGGNIGKNKVTPNELAWKDYVTCFEALFDYVDYFVVNVSSPNTPGLRELQEKSALQTIFTKLQTINTKKPNPKPLLLKIAPDLTIEQLDDIVALAKELSLDGIIATNTTISRTNLVTAKAEIDSIGIGGLSGRPLEANSNVVLQYLKQRLPDNVLLIGSGGVFTKKDVDNKLVLGASLVQVWTGFVYEGPMIVKKLLG